MIHFVSDTHWFHANVIRYSSRPFSSVEEMNEALIDNWNRVVKKGDTVYHLGDFSFGRLHQTKEVINRLNGQIHLIFGNHDKDLQKNRKDLLAGGFFESMQDYKRLNIGNEIPNIILFHYGMRVWDKKHYGSIHLFGHSHNSLPPFGKSVDVGVDCKEITPEYRPVSLEEVLEFMKKREDVVVDHHGANRMEDE